MKCVNCGHDRLKFNPTDEDRKHAYRHYYIMSPYGKKGILLCQQCYEAYELEQKFLRQKFNLTST